MTALMATDRWLFAPAQGRALAAARAGLAAVIGLRLATFSYASFAGQPPALFRPPPVLAWLPAMPSAGALVALQVVGTAAAVVAVLGRWRPAAAFAVAWAVLLVLAGLRGSLGKVLHNDVLLLLAALPIVASASGPRLGERQRSRRWGWPVRTAAVVIALVYFATGVQKLRHSGWSWVASDNMRWVLYAAAAGDRPALPGLARAVAGHAWLSTTAAASVLLVELSAPLVLLWRRSTLVFVALAAGLHAGTWLLLGLDYWGWALTVAAVALPLRWWAHDRPPPPAAGSSGVGP